MNSISISQGVNDPNQPEFERLKGFHLTLNDDSIKGHSFHEFRPDECCGFIRMGAIDRIHEVAVGEIIPLLGFRRNVSPFLFRKGRNAQGSERNRDKCRSFHDAVRPSNLLNVQYDLR